MVVELPKNLPKGLPRSHYIVLVCILVGAIALRFWHLGIKPLWLDEVIGALFSLGRGLDAVPLTTVFPVTQLVDIFAFQPGQSCAQITHTVATESVHPPLFFCLQYRWLGVWLPLLSTGMSESGTQILASPHWIWVLRSLPALFGIGCVAAVYGLARLMVSPATGLIAAALMAVSPFAVYLSQEARHYTLPMLWTILALMALVLMQRRMLGDRPLPWLLLLGWSLINSLGLYTHYFFLLDFTAQGMAIGGWLAWQRFGAAATHIPKRFRQYVSQLSLGITISIVSYLPWLPTLLHHINRPETDWLKPYKPDWSDRLAPLYQTVMGWILMGINLPVESQPWAIAIPSITIMLILSGWLGWHILQGLRSHWQTITLRPSLQLLYLLLASLLIQVFAIVYLLDKDITAIPRYNFISYPILLLLFAIGLTPRSWERTRNEERGTKTAPAPRLHASTSPLPLFIALLAALVSVLFVVHGVVFQKGYYPHQVAEDMTQFPEQSLLVAVSYESLQEVALGLSFALEVEKRYAKMGENPAHFIFIDRTNGYGEAWQQLRTAPHGLSLPLNLWAIASPGMKTKDYPPTLKVQRPHRRAKVTCAIAPDYFHRIGFPYQLFRCPPPS